MTTTTLPVRRSPSLTWLFGEIVGGMFAFMLPGLIAGQLSETAARWGVVLAAILVVPAELLRQYAASHGMEEIRERVRSYLLPESFAPPIRRIGLEDAYLRLGEGVLAHYEAANVADPLSELGAAHRQLLAELRAEVAALRERRAMTDHLIASIDRIDDLIRAVHHTAEQMNAVVHQLEPIFARAEAVNRETADLISGFTRELDRSLSERFEEQQRSVDEIMRKHLEAMNARSRWNEIVARIERPRLQEPHSPVALAHRTVGEQVVRVPPYGPEMFGEDAGSRWEAVFADYVRAYDVFANPKERRSMWAVAYYGFAGRLLERGPGWWWRRTLAIHRGKPDER